MNKHKYISAVIILTVWLYFTACSNHPDNTPHSDKISIEKSLAQQTNSSTTDSLTLQNDELTKIYVKGIAAFIKAAYKINKTTFDTLYFGKHIYGQPDDFPDIELPEIIEKTQIRLVSPEVAQKKQAERKSLVYVNMIGWVDKESAAFVLVVFTNNAQHQSDYYINFNFNKSSAKYELYKIEFQNYMVSNEHSLKRITIYEDGNYVTDN